MSCIEKDILYKYVVNELTLKEREEVKKHIKHCGKCKGVVESYYKLSRLLSSKKEEWWEYKSRQKTKNCPTPEDLDAYVHKVYFNHDIDITEEKITKIKTHLKKCSYCFHIVAEIFKEIDEVLEKFKKPKKSSWQEIKEDIYKGNGKTRKLVREVCIEYLKNNKPQEREEFETVFSPVYDTVRRILIIPEPDKRDEIKYGTLAFGPPPPNIYLSASLIFIAFSFIVEVIYSLSPPILEEKLDEKLKQISTKLVERKLDKKLVKGIIPIIKQLVQKIYKNM